MNFHMDLDLPASPETIWPIFFDVARIARLIPGCEQVEEKEPLVLYGAVMKQKIGPFKLEVPTEVKVEEMVAPAGGPLGIKMGVEDVGLDVSAENLTLKVRFGFTQKQLHG